MKRIAVTVLAAGLVLGLASGANAQSGLVHADTMGVELANALNVATGEEGPGFAVYVEPSIGPGGAQLWAENPLAGSLGILFPGFTFDPDTWSADYFTGLKLPVIDYGNSISITYNNSAYGWSGGIPCLPGQSVGCIPRWCLVASECCPAATAFCVPPDVFAWVDIKDSGLTAIQREGLWQFVAGTAVLGLGCLTGADTCDVLIEAATSEALERCLTDASSCFKYATDFDWEPDVNLEFRSFGIGAINGGG